ncbi:MAG: thioredoxin family protein [Proteobacteria bacterium]|nr:thioredoxin family protein [Pseudomonadota bacterium]
MILKLKKITLFFFLLCGLFSYLSLICLPSPLFASPKDPIQVQILSSSTHFGKETSLLLGLEITLQEGWHIYAPQKEAVFPPPTFENNTSLNMGTLTFFWPPAQKISKGAEDILVYAQKIILPFTSSILDPSKTAVLKTTLKLIACNHRQCMPYNKDLHYTISPGSLEETPEAPLLKAALKNASLEFPSSLPSQKNAFLMFLTILGSAFLGGLILNFMPCVLPVLSLKFLSVLKKRSSSETIPLSHLKIRFLMSFLGILTFFCGFGLISSSARFFGKHIGWGFQFQSPSFLGIMILILFLFSLNLWGFFEINLPSFLLEWINKHTVIPQKIKTSEATFSSFANDYASGLFSALLATPCTAPFLSVALGASLTQDPFRIFFIFLVIGIGFGFPYLLMTFYPQILLKLPAPGSWMKTFKRILSLGLFGTGLWLLFVLVMPYISVSKSDSEWIPYSSQSLENHLQKGDSVLVDVTAEWCLTCKMNKFRVFQNHTFKKLAKEHGLILMRADWTRPNAKIEDYLKSYGRTAIPFTVYYTPLHPKGLILPELLTPSFLINFLQETP